MPSVEAYPCLFLWLAVLVPVSGCSPAPTADPESVPSAPFALAYQAGKHEPAIAAAQAQARASSDQVEPYVRLAEAFLLRRRETDDPALLGYAQDALQAAIARAPGDPQVRIVQVLLSLDGHRFAEARDTARAIVAEHPQNATAHLLLSDAFLELGDYDQAIDALQEAMYISPDLRTYSRTAYLRWLHGDIEGAVEAIAAALQVSSQRPEAIAWCYVDLGRIWWHRGRLAAALAAVQRALMRVPNYAPALVLRARVLAAQGQRDQAIAILERVVAGASTAESLVYLSELLDRAGRTREAAAYLDRAERLASHDPLPVALYYARHNRHGARALELAQTAVRERDTIFTRDVYALALLRQGRIQEAAAAMDKALRLQTPDARLLLHRALIEFAAGDVPKAQASLAEAQRLNPYVDTVLVTELRQGLESPR